MKKCFYIENIVLSSQLFSDAWINQPQVGFVLIGAGMNKYKSSQTITIYYVKAPAIVTTNQKHNIQGYWMILASERSLNHD